MVEWMDYGDPFDITFVTCDQKKGTGGELITITGGRKTEWLSRSEYKKQQALQPSSRLKLKKDPRHYENSTRNITLSNGDVRKVHLRLIRRFNGKKVL